MALRKRHNYTIYINKLEVITFGLLFFLLQACNKEFPIQVVTKDDTIEITKGTSSFNENDIKISLHNSVDKPSILGKITNTDSSYIFKPLITFTKGLTYNVYIKDTLIESITFDEKKDFTEKTGLSIYPSKNILPENLLKVYLEFSKPMKEVNNSLKYITVKNITKDSIVDVFLKLSPELWNENHSRLTLWLDPGRIKTDLIPNQKMGLPIQKENEYSIHVSSDWKDINGTSIDIHVKKFRVVERDNKSPKINEWELKLPQNSTKDTLKINFNEVLDAVLSKENIFIIDNEENRVEGRVILTNNESVLNFIPKTTWNKSAYTIEVDPKLEDLAGNNLIRLFDVDNTTKVDALKDGFNEIEFRID